MPRNPQTEASSSKVILSLSGLSAHNLLPQHANSALWCLIAEQQAHDHDKIDVKHPQKVAFRVKDQKQKEEVTKQVFHNNGLPI